VDVVGLEMGTDAECLVTVEGTTMAAMLVDSEMLTVIEGSIIAVAFVNSANKPVILSREDSGSNIAGF
jgi:hypothetical protein